MIQDGDDSTLAKVFKDIMLSDKTQDVEIHDDLLEMGDEEEQIRQYLAWKFHEMKLLVGSDACICTAPKTNNPVSDGSSSDQRRNDDTMTIRLAELKEFEAQVTQHQKFVSNGHFIPDSSSFVKQRESKSYAEMVSIEEKSSNRKNVVPGSFNPINFHDISLQNTSLPPNSMTGLMTNKQYVNNDSTSSPVWTCIDAYLDNVSQSFVRNCYI